MLDRDLVRQWKEMRKEQARTRGRTINIIGSLLLFVVTPLAEVGIIGEFSSTNAFGWAVAIWLFVGIPCLVLVLETLLAYRDRKTRRAHFPCLEEIIKRRWEYANRTGTSLAEYRVRRQWLRAKERTLDGLV